MTRRRDDSRLAKSERPDGRGHWPADTPRSDLRPGVMAALRAARTTMSYRAIGVRLGTDGRTVHRWLSGLWQPSEEYQARILREWGPGRERGGRP